MTNTSLPPNSLFRRIVFSVALLVSLGEVAVHAGEKADPPLVGYSPTIQAIQGPSTGFFFTYPLTITAPSNVSGPTVISFTVTPNAIPAGVSLTTMLGYVRITSATGAVLTGTNPRTLTFSSAGEQQTVTVTMTVPNGAVPDPDYGYQIFTAGWPVDPDPDNATGNNGTSINATVSQPAQVPSASVVISTPTDMQPFTVAPTAMPATIPLRFVSTATSANPVTSVDANVDGVNITLTSTSTNGNATVTSNGNMTILLPGTYHVQARAFNAGGTGTQTNTFSVTVNGIAPTVTIAHPTVNQNIVLVAGTTPVIPFDFSAVSLFGGISSISATLNGQTINGLNISGLNSLLVNGSTLNLAVSAVGTYNLVVTATNPYGSASATRTFTISNPTTAPKLTLSIAQPIDGNIITRVAGSPATAVPFSFTATETNGTVSTLSATVGTSNVTVSSTGLNTASATGTGTFYVSASGNYTLTAKATGTGGLTTTATAKVIVKETQPAPQPCPITVLWLQPIACGQVLKGGSTASVAFQLQQCCTDRPTVHNYGDDDDDDDDDRHNCRDARDDDKGDHSRGDCAVKGTTCKYIKDTSVVVAIYEIYTNGTYGPAKYFTYTSGNLNGTHYKISNENIYKLSYTTGSGKHRYRAEVSNFASGSSTATLLGTKEFTTK